MQPDTLGKRLEAIAGPGVLPVDGAFDPSRPPHVDAAARKLLERFYREDDGAAFALLVEISQPLLEGGAHQITRDHGLAIDPRELVSEHLARVYVDLSRPARIPESFVDDALQAMDAEAERHVAALAGTTAGTAGTATEADPPAERLAARFAALVSACFHALPADDRRILIALEVDRLSHAEIAERFGIYQDEVAQRIVETRGRLAARLAAAFASLEPRRRDLS